MSRKISLRFILYFLGFYASLVLLTISLLIFYLAEPFLGFDIYATMKTIEADQIEAHVKEDSNGDYYFSDKLIEFSSKNQGVLQLVSKQGNVIESSSNSTDLPTYYAFSDLSKLHSQEKYSSWLLENRMILLFTEQTNSDLLMEQLIETVEFPSLSEVDVALIKEFDAVFDLYDKNGKLITTTDEQKVQNITNAFPTNFLLDSSEEIKSYHTMKNGSVAIIRIPNIHFETFDTAGYNAFITLLKALGVFHGLLLIIIILFSLLMGRRFGRPLLYFLRRIERLAKNDYSDVDDKRLHASKTGKLKKRYKIYEDVDNSLTLLTHNLIENEEKIRTTEKLREDWITGLSHDLKTPLSAVLGYSAMLGSSHEWTKAELIKFAGVIEDKAQYMDGLINDLTYTYQLKNQAVVLNLVETELNQFVTDYLKTSTFEIVTFDKQLESVLVLIDPKRFGRILDNVIGNAMTHNSIDTKINVHISSEYDKAVIEIKDDGVGMSEETLTNLFNRYYRGTNTTADDAGTGLGLTIAKQLIEAHDGDIYVSSDSEGTVIKITLPK